MSNEYSLKDLLPFLELDEYISFDLETTGLNPDKDQITEIAACRFVNGEFTEEYTTLINPGIPIPKNITALTGISNKMVEESKESLVAEKDKIDPNSPLAKEPISEEIEFDDFAKEIATDITNNDPSTLEDWVKSFNIECDPY